MLALLMTNESLNLGPFALDDDDTPEFEEVLAPEPESPLTPAPFDPSHLAPSLKPGGSTGAEPECQLIGTRFKRDKTDGIELLDTKEAARRLHISRNTLYGWLKSSNAGNFKLRFETVTIWHLQGGAKNQGRILIPATEVERLLSLMEVAPSPKRKRRRPNKNPPLRYITGKLGRPDDF